MNLSATHEAIRFEYCVATRMQASAAAEIARYKGTPQVYYQQMYENDLSRANLLIDVLARILDTMPPRIAAHIRREGDKAHADQTRWAEDRIARQIANEQRHQARMLAG